MDRFCQNVKEKLKTKLPAHSYNMWIDPLSIMVFEDNRVVIGCKNSFFKKRIVENYSALLKDAVYEDPGFQDYKIEFSESDLSAGGDKKAPAKKKNEEEHTIIKPSGMERHLYAKKSQMNFEIDTSRFQGGRILRRGFTLDNFVVGKNSEFAYSAALSLAAGSRLGYNAVYIQSNTGLGKSHLSQAVGHHILSNAPTDSVYYVSAEDFTNEMVSSLKHDKIDSFKERYRKNCDVLLMDDVQFLSGKPRTQQELSMILDYLMEADKKIIFSGSHLPLEIPKLNDQLKSRLSSSLLSIIDKPDFKTRLKIARKKALNGGYDLPSNIIEYLASELTDNIRQLEAGIRSVGIKSSLLGQPVTYSLVEEVISEISEKSKEVTIDAIKKLVAKEFGLSVDHLVSKSRKKTIVRPRQIAIYLSRKYTDQPLQFIGKSFNRYHATAIHAIKAVKQGIKLNDSTYKPVELLSKKLEEGTF